MATLIAFKSSHRPENLSCSGAATGMLLGSFVDGKLLDIWGIQGRAPGQLFYPYDLVLDERNIYICEYGNNRIQKFTLDGKSLGCLGQAGRKKGQLHNPWALVQDSGGRLFVVDTNNHRVQQIRM